jgi:hypothetical protein
MQKLFNNSYDIDIEMAVSRKGGISIHIEGEFINSDRKSQLYVNADRLSTEVKRLWDYIKERTTKLIAIGMSFSEIDWYDDMCDMYETPTFTIRKGMRSVQVGEKTHGSIPKDWSVCISARFDTTNHVKPYMLFINEVLSGYRYNVEEVEKAIRKGIKNGHKMNYMVEATSTERSYW